MEPSGGRVSAYEFKAVAGLALLLSIIAPVVRIGGRLWRERRLRTDDYFLLLSCACLIASTVLFYRSISTVFFIAALLVNPGQLTDAGVSQDEIEREILIFETVHRAFMALNWASIFAVKFGFLAFFRHLVDRIPVMYNFWRCSVGFTTLAAFVCVFNSFFICPRVGHDAVQCFSQPGAVPKYFALGVTTILLDILTDIMIIVTPIALIWRVQIKNSQKFGLAAFLCLSVSMIVIAIIRLSGWRYKGAYDNTWIILWQQIESCVAVTMLSLTAFRSIFVSQPSSARARSWVPSSRTFLSKFKKSASTNDAQRLDDLSIPSGELTGLGTMMGRDKTFHTLVVDSDRRWLTSGSINSGHNV